MGTIFHTADLHLGISTHGALDPVSGVSTRLRDIEGAMQFIAATVIDYSVDTLVIAGDITHSTSLSNVEFALLMRWLESLRIPVVIGGGNHDGEKHPARRGLMQALSTLDEVYAFDRPASVVVGDDEFVVFPYPNRAAIAAAGMTGDGVDAAVASILTSLKTTRSPIIVAHATVAGSRYSANAQPNLMVGGDFVVPLTTLTPDWASVALLGHIHTPQNCTDTLWYSGAPLSFDFGDEGARGGVLYDSDTGDTKFVENSTDRKFVTITAPDGAPIFPSSVEDAFVRISINCKAADSWKREMEEEVTKRGGRLVAIKEAVESTVRPQAKAVAEAVTDADAVRAFCEAKGGDIEARAEDIVGLMQEVDHA
jgi:exonuclease SbcD